MSCALCPTPFAQQHLKLSGPPNSGRSVAEWAPSLKRATDACVLASNNASPAQRGPRRDAQSLHATPLAAVLGFLFWAQPSFPENKKENRGSPALCVSGNFQGKQRVFGAPFWKLASFPESESWSGAKSEAKLRKSTKYPGGRRVISRYTRVLREIPGILPIWPKIWQRFGAKPASDSAQSQKIDDFHAVFPGK